MFRLERAKSFVTFFIKAQVTYAKLYLEIILTKLFLDYVDIIFRIKLHKRSYGLKINPNMNKLRPNFFSSTHQLLYSYANKLQIRRRDILC